MSRYFATKIICQILVKYYVRRPPGISPRACDLLNVAPDRLFKQAPTVMIWGEMSINGTDALFFLPSGTTMNGKKIHRFVVEQVEATLGRS